MTKLTADPTGGTPEQERRRIIRSARRQLKEIEQYFVDIASWNDNSVARKNGAEPIDPDPDGHMGRMANALREMLAIDAAEGHKGQIVAPSLSMMFGTRTKEPQ